MSFNYIILNKDSQNNVNNFPALSTFLWVFLFKILELLLLIQVLLDLSSLYCVSHYGL